MVDEVDLLEKFLLADIATKLWLFQMHLAMRKQSAGGLQHLSAIGTLLLRRLSRLYLRQGSHRMAVFVLFETLVALKVQVTLSTDFAPVNRGFVEIQVAPLRVTVGAFVALISANQMALEVVSQQDKLFGIVITNNTCKYNRPILVRIFVVEFKGHPVIENVSIGRTIDA